MGRLMAAFVVMPVNHHEITGFPDLCHDLGYRPLYIMMEPVEAPAPVREAALESIERGLERAREPGATQAHGREAASGRGQESRRYRWRREGIGGAGSP